MHSDNKSGKVKRIVFWLPEDAKLSHSQMAMSTEEESIAVYSFDKLKQCLTGHASIELAVIMVDESSGGHLQSANMIQLAETFSHIPFVSVAPSKTEVA